MKEKFRYTGFCHPAGVRGNKRAPEQLGGHIIEVYAIEPLRWHSRKNYLVPAGMLKLVYKADLGDALLEMAEKQKLSKSFGAAEEYLETRLERRQGDVYYDFNIRREAISLERPLEYHITCYLAVEERMEKMSEERAIVFARPGKDGKPSGSVQIRYFKNNLDPAMN